jgi:hypothetical protein
MYLLRHTALEEAALLFAGLLVFSTFLFQAMFYALVRTGLNIFSLR